MCGAMAAVGARLRGAVLLVRDVEEALRFYVNGLGLAVLHRDEQVAELASGGHTTLSIQAVQPGCVPSHA